MVTLSPEQRRLVEQVTAARRVQRTAREDAEVAARRLVDERTEEANRALSRAVRHAIDGGVPRLRVAREGIGVQDTRTIDRFLAYTDEEARIEAAVIEHHAVERFRLATREEREPYAWARSAEWALRVDWPNYVPADGSRLTRPAFALDGYAEGTVPLHGIIAPSRNRRAKFERVVDDFHATWQERLELDALEVATAEEHFIAAAERIVAGL